METTLASIVIAALSSSLVASLVQLARMRCRAELAWHEARTDDATQIGNRRAWRERVDGLRDLGQAFAFVSLDVANLKAANAAIGHAQSDAILREVARHVRSTEGLCGSRVGGDEFAIALPGASPADARALRDRIEDQVGCLVLPGGVAVFVVGVVGRWRPGMDLDAELTDADFRLDQRKAARKGRLGCPLTRAESLARVSGAPPKGRLADLPMVG